MYIQLYPGECSCSTVFLKEGSGDSKTSMLTNLNLNLKCSVNEKSGNIKHHSANM